MTMNEATIDADTAMTSYYERVKDVREPWKDAYEVLVEFLDEKHLGPELNQYLLAKSQALT